MTLEKKHYIWIGFGILAVLIYFSWNTYSEQSKTAAEVKAQARQINGLQGNDTVTAKDLLATMSKNMQDQKPTINFTV